MKKIISKLLCTIILASVLLNVTGCSTPVKAQDLMKNVIAGKVTAKQADDEFIRSSADFAVKLFQGCDLSDDNTLVSPLSVMLALAMTANGADGDTKAQMQKLIGGDIPLDRMNEYLCNVINSLPFDEKCKINVANSIWFRKNMPVKQDFLQINADYYKAAAYSAPFDDSTVKDINNWVSNATKGMIKEIVKEINPDTMMYLINALTFDAEWQEIYRKSGISEDTFTALNGTARTVEMMHSSEAQYISDTHATGFIKPYNGGKYSFVALLPDEDTGIEEYIKSLSGERLIKLIKNAEGASVDAGIPKFSYDYKITLNDTLKKLGMTDAFDAEKADFSLMADKSLGLYVSEVLHKTYISVDERGTKAGAVTKVEMDKASAVENNYKVILNRPFVYAIVESNTGLPAFIGTVTDIEE